MSGRPTDGLRQLGPGDGLIRIRMKGIQMIVLQIQLSPGPGREDEIEEAVRKRFLPAMSRQPGFVQAHLTGPCSVEVLAAVGAQKPSFQFQVTALWNSEDERKDWVARDIHQEVFGEISSLCVQTNALLLDVVQSW